ncbi:MAG: hypothetical protein WC774_01115 [Candidatus Gracilibacteria bacterium]
MNSSEFQKNFPAIYKNFFNAHNIVLSSSSILTWGADISHGISALRIKQKLPMKTFCAANLNSSSKITFGSIFHYSSKEDNFKEDNFDIFFKHDTERISLFLQDFLVKNGFSGGMEIDFLSEAPRGHGFSFTGVISVLLTFLIHTIARKFDTKILSSRELSIIEKTLFDELYDFSLGLSDCISQGKSIGNANNYVAMLPAHSLPIVYLSGNRNLDDKDSSSIDIVTHKDTLLHFLGINNNSLDELPLDYGVIYTGMEYTFSEIESMRERVKKESDRVDSFIKNTIQSLHIQEADGMNFSNILNFNKDKVHYSNVDNTNLKILEGFDYLLKNTHDDNIGSTFIGAINSIGLTSFSYQKENKLFFALKYFFSQYKQFEDEEIGIMPFNTGKIGGSLLFVMKYGKSRETIQKVLNYLRDNGHIAFLDYTSWRDGYSSDGIYLEQYLTENLYSEYTKAGNMKFTDTFGKTYFGDYDTIIKNEKNCILLDTIEGKIYIGEVKFTSKEIHSQGATIDTMRILLENIGEEILNTSLPASSYSHNKNEIMGKIVLPIRKLTKKYFGKEIPLFCSGGVNSYCLRLDRDESIRIGIITRM